VETASPAGSHTSILPGGARIASRYTIEAVIGEGMSGVVYRARRDGAGELVALKIIHRELCSDEQISRRFQREAQILKRIEGPHVVKLHDLAEDDGRLVIVLQYVDAISLEAMLIHSPPTMDQAVEIALQICAALGAAHAAGVVHRDLKPANVLIERLAAKSTGLWARVVDFGLAKVVRGDPQIGAAITERDMIFGTPEYMAPEQVRGDDVDLRADIYAAGVILFEMIIGEVPFSGRTPLDTMDAHLKGEVPRPRVTKLGAAVPPGLAAVILRALAKEPLERYRSARAFAEALTAAWGERLVITPLGIENVEAIATIDTELNVSTEGVRTSEASPAEAPLAPPQDAIPTVRRPEAASPGDRVFWLIAVVIAVICVGIGVWIGIR